MPEQQSGRNEAVAPVNIRFRSAALRLERALWPSIRFLFQTEVHVYAFAVAANMLMSFFPFLVAIISLCRSVLHSRAAVDVIFRTLNDYFPENFGVPFRSYLNAAAAHPFSWILCCSCYSRQTAFSFRWRLR